MSQFDRYASAEYVEALRSFLRKKKQNFLRDSQLIPEGHVVKPGRGPRYAEEPLAVLEAEVNQKAERAEQDGLTLGERINIARDYKGLNAAELGTHLGVSRELVRLWGANVHRPTNLAELAAVLDVPVNWLEFGGQVHLPANSHIGVRVGQENLLYREELYAKTLALMPEIPEEAEVDYAQAYVEWAVFNKEGFSHVARRAGGRWHIVGGALVFAPWVPIKEHELTRRYWSDTVEAIIEEELINQTSIYAAWAALKKRCEALGLTSKEYPKKISLHKRAEKDRARADKYGVNLNPMINAAVAKYAKAH